jgi:hypothetical protein
MMFRRTLLLALFQVGSATAAGLGINSAEVPNRQAPPELHRAMQVLSGSWTISEEYPPSALYPNGGVGHGTEVWRAGPGNVTLVYEYHSTNPAGEMWATAVLWWDSEAKKLRELWCTSQNRKGCVVSTADIRWEGEELVFSDSREVKGKRLFSREVWSELKSDTHTMSISESTTNGNFKPWMISRAARVR